MSWAATENFDSYASGNNLNTLNGGSGFTAAWANSSTNFTISNGQALSGTLAAKIAAATTGGAGTTASGTAPYRPFTALAIGEFTVSIYKTGSGDSAYFILSNSSFRDSFFCIVGLEGSNWVAYDKNGTRQINNATTTGAWHTFKIKFDTGAGTFQVAIDGGAYSSTMTFGSTNPDTLGLYKGNGGLSSDIYFDSIGPVAGTAWTQTCTESIANTATLLKTTARTVSEAISLTATLAKTATRPLSEAITNTDTLIRTASRSLIEAITHSDTFAGLRTKPLNATESITVTAAIIRTITRLFSEAITNSDTLVKTASRALSEALTLAPTLLETPGRTFSEAVTATDSLVRTTTRTFSESVISTATFFKVTGRALSENITNSDTIAHLRTSFAALTELATVTDALIKTASRTLSEAITNSDTLAKARQRFATLTDAVTATDTFIHAAILLLRLVETVSLADLFHTFRNGFDVFWRNVSKSATGTINNMAKSVTTWRNKDRS